MKVVILGANGKVGSQVAAQLVAHGHEVIAGIHKRHDHVPDGAKTVEINIFDKTSLTKAISGADAVVCTLSSWHAPQHNVLSTAMKTVIPAMQQNNIKRIVSVSGDVARLPGEKPPLLTRLFHLLAFGIVKQVVADSEDHLQQLYDSDLSWTVLRPTTMTAAPHSNYKLQSTHPLQFTVPRAAVVKSIVDLIETPSHIKEAPFIKN